MSHIFRFIGTRDQSGRWTLPEEELKHIHVVGLKQQDSLELIDGKGSFAFAKILNISSKHIDLEEVPGSFKLITQPPFKLGVVTGILKNSQDLLSCLTEIGVDNIYMFSQPHSRKDLTQRLEQKFQSIVRSSTKQSKRYFIPHILCFSSFEKCLDYINTDPTTVDSRKILLDESSTDSLLDICISEKDSLLLFTGSELGFTQEELSLLKKERMESFNIGTHILKSIHASTCASMILNLKIEKIRNNQ